MPPPPPSPSLIVVVVVYSPYAQGEGGHVHKVSLSINSRINTQLIMFVNLEFDHQQKVPTSLFTTMENKKFRIEREGVYYSKKIDKSLS